MARFTMATTFCAFLTATASASPVYHASDNGAMLTVTGDSVSVSLHANGQILAGTGRITKDFSELFLFPVDSRMSRKAEQSGTGENNAAGSGDDEEDESQDASTEVGSAWKASFIIIDGKAQGVIEHTNGKSQIFSAQLAASGATQKAEQSGTGE